MLFYVIVAGRISWPGVRQVGNLYDAAPIYNCFPQLQKREGMRYFSHIHDTFLMAVIKDIEGNLERRISEKAIALIQTYGSFYVQFTSFSYLRVRGYKKAPLKLPRYASDYLVFLELCR